MSTVAPLVLLRGHARAGADRVFPASSDLEAVLELLPDGAVVVDPAHRVVATNAEFRRSERRRAALVVRDGLLSAMHAAAAAHLAERLTLVLRDGVERVLRVPVTGSADTLELRIAAYAVGDGGRHAIVLVHDLRRMRAVCTARLRELYALTRAEADLAARLAAGASLEQAAAQLDVSLNTVRTHLRRLFAKCGVATQAALLQHLALGAARVGRRDEVESVDDDAAPVPGASSP